MVSEDFSVALLNPNSVKYKEETKKYTNIIQNTYRKSHLRDALVRILIDGFSSGSVKIFFKVILDRKFLPGRTTEDPVVAARDVLVQEVMSLDKSEFEGATIDLDSIEFSLSAVQDIAKKYLEPEPFQGDKDAAASSGGSLWQNLAQSVVAATPSASTMATRMEAADAAGAADTFPTDWRGQPLPGETEEEGDGGLYNQLPWQQPNGQFIQEINNNNGWSLPRYPTQQTGYEIKNNLVRSPAYSNVVTPQSPLIISQQQQLAARGGVVDPNFPVITAPPSPGGYLGSLLPDYSVGTSRVDSQDSGAGNLMSPYLAAPPPPPPSSPALGAPGRPLDLDLKFSEDNSVAAGLENLFNDRKKDPQQPEQFIPLEKSDNRRSGLRQAANRRMEVVTFNPPTSTPGPTNSFWNVMQQRIKDKQEKSTEASFKRILNQPDLTIALGSDSLAVSSMQEELQRLLALRNRDSRKKNAATGPNSRTLEPMMPISDSGDKPSIAWGSVNSGEQEDPVMVNNFGSSGMKAITARSLLSRGSTTTEQPSASFVDVMVPKDQQDGFFGVGSSLSFAGEGGVTPNPGPSGPVLNSLPSLNRDQVLASSYHIGDDPNIIYPHQITPGMPLMQGPQGPMVATPRVPMNFVPQTPLAPITPNPDQFAAVGGGGHLRLGPPQRSLEAFLAAQQQNNNIRMGTPGQQQMQHQNQRPQQFQQPNNIETPTPLRVASSNAPQRKADTERRVEGGSRRQDLISGLLPAAIGLSSAGISPVGIFSNLLNAYATIDSKHDITGKLISGAASWFSPASTPEDTAVVKEEEDQQESTTTTTTTESSTSTTTMTTTSAIASSSINERWLSSAGELPVQISDRYVPTPANVRVRDRVSTFSYSSNEDDSEDEYVSLLKRIKSGIGSSSNSLNSKLVSSNSNREEYDVVYDRAPPARSNLNPEGPLRPKPPSEAIVQVSPSPPNRYGNSDSNEYELRRYGVNNPAWFSQGQQASSSTAGYGPDDFIVETVNLDKDFFYQFFTSKPMIIDTDVVTSTSVQVTYDYQQLGKRGRGESLSDLPEHLDSAAASEKEMELADLSTTTVPTVHFVTKPSEVPEILNNVSKFKRYHVPPEVRITHNLNMPKNRQVNQDLYINY